jgi:hypothetical protein
MRWITGCYSAGRREFLRWRRRAEGFAAGFGTGVPFEKRMCDLTLIGSADR